MLENKRYSDYDNFAWVYNKHWGNQFTPAAFAALEKLAFPRIKSDARILDLCCGTGHKTHLLAKRGYVTTGLDSSEKMLKYARENAPEVELILADARAFKLPAVYDLVVSMFDSLNHIMAFDELVAVFRNVHDCLKAGGLFLFDVNLEPGYIATYVGWNAFIEDDHVCVFPNNYDAEKRIGKVDFTLFRLDDGSWRRSDFSLTQRCYSHEELLAALRKAGYSEIEDYSYDRQNGIAALTPASPRAFFLCRKT